MPSLQLAVLLLAAAQAPAPAVGAPPATQPTPPAVRSVLGEVTAFDAATGRLRIRPDRGDETAVDTVTGATCIKVPPGSKSLANGTSIPCTAITVGDRVFARGTGTTDAGVLAARQVVVMTKDALDERRTAERAEWQRRGIGGVVTAVDPQKQEITIEIRSLAGKRDVVLAPASATTTFRRYAPGSARFADAQPCTLADVHVGDQVRALGDRSPDGTRFLAEQVVAGAFRTLLGTVESVEPDAGTVVLTGVVSARGNGGVMPRRTIMLGPAARLRRLPAEMADRLAMRASRGPGGGRMEGRPWPGRARPEGSGGPQAEGPRRPGLGGGEGPGGRVGGNPPTLGEMLDRFPPVTLADLSHGELVAVAVAEEGTSEDKPLLATALLAGIEPLVRTPQPAGGNGNLQTGLAQGALDLGMGMGE
jgi:hypothetical protein